MKLPRALLLVLLLGGCTQLSQLWQTGPEPVKHVVAKGDTLWAIAKEHDVSIEEIRAWNQLEGDRIEVGQELLIYTEEAPAAVAEVAPKGSRKRRKKKTGGGGTVQAPAGAPEAAADLAMPAEKACLQGPDVDALGEGEEPEFQASVGLSYEQIRGSMRAFVGNTLRCVPEGTTQGGTMELEITVACTGRVSRVEVVDTGGLPAELVACVPGVLKYAPFPAHQLPDGETFGYPLTFSF